MTKRNIMMILTASLATPVMADNNPAYWVGSDGEYVRSGYGYCVRTINWTAEKAIAGCEGGEATVKLKAAPAKIQDQSADSKAADEAAARARAEKEAAARDAAAKAKAERDAAAAAAAASAGSAEPEYRNLSLSSGATFELGGSTLSQSGKAAVASILRQFEGEEIKAVLVEGHTDDRGAASFNQQLSEKRAAAVRDELIANGVDAKLIKTKGYGESTPIADNSTRDGRAKNRRVQIKVDARTRQL